MKTESGNLETVKYIDLAKKFDFWMNKLHPKLILKEKPNYPVSNDTYLFSYKNNVRTRIFIFDVRASELYFNYDVFHLVLPWCNVELNHSEKLELLKIYGQQAYGLPVIQSYFLF